MILLAWGVLAVLGLVAANLGERRARWAMAGYGAVAVVLASGAVVLQGPAAWFGIAVAGAALLPPMRRFYAEGWPLFHDESPLHAVALSLFLYALTLLLHLQLAPDRTAAVLRGGVPWAPVVASVMAAALAVTGAGLGTRRGLRAALHRLGADRVSGRSAAMSAGLGVAAALCLLLVHGVGHIVLPAIPRLPADTLALPAAIGRESVPLGLLLLLAAGEEILLRGAVRPRLGNFYAAVIFAVAHSPRGGGVGVLDVLAVGILLGRTWQRAGLLGSVIARGAYAATVLLAVGLRL